MAVIDKKKTGTVAGQYVSLLLDYLRSRGHSPEALFGAARIAGIESADAPVRLTTEEYFGILDQAVAVTSDPDLGFHAGMLVAPRHLGVVGYVVMCSTKLGEALTQYDRYVRLVHGIGRPLVVRHDDRVEMPLDWSGTSAPPPAFAQLIMTTRARMGRLLTGRETVPLDVDFQFATPRDSDAYHRFFGGKINFAATQTRLMFPADYLELPVIMASAEMARVIGARAEAQMIRLADEPEFMRELKTMLTQGLAIGHIGAVDIAQRMGISSRTLHRRLSGYAYVFRDVLDDVRRERAESYLAQSQHSLAEVAFLLGYTEQSAFQHAFKRWTGMTPQRYRVGSAPK
ncbi:AraC family transcriptional regulator [Paraburkholderia megapolitana]|uniref:Helix-turn-helix domain-containing protein n=1 Tax=Paraburkholderia megapolitana TaxID=420953 RepID=A0A1I3VYH7_9BURK|nr:AraC family transcriptional regulator [Paraburkholderia megapolitana]QDQ82175.1 AraC family transcriptional regulator [Paraburkholderia megapolitana]SFK00003.1 Helix-turn-helix domain-containing protein [Paraburkholderia megapolitana]